MLRFISLSLRNFLSYGNNTTVIQLNRPGTTLILGEDLDNTTSGVGANGVGKSTMINALAYAVYDTPVSNISKDNLINNINKKNMEVTVDFEIKGNRYRVHRVRKGGSNGRENYVHVYENDKDITPDSISNANALIEKIVGVKYELFVRIVVFSATHIPFLDLPLKSHYAANQTDIIEELFDLTTLSAKANALKEVIKETEQRLETHKSKISQIEKEHNRHKEQIRSAELRVVTWEQQNKKAITDLETKLKKLENVNFDIERQLQEDTRLLAEDIAQKLTEQREVETAIKKHEKVIEKCNHDLTHLRDQKCPYCLQKYKDTANKISELEVNLLEATNQINILKPQYETIKISIKELVTKHKEIEKQITVHDLEELLEIKNQSVTMHEKISDLKKAINPFIEPLEELESTELDKINYDQINDLNNQLEHQNFLLKLLTKKDSFVRKTLLNKNLPFLNSRLQHYLTLLGLQHKVEFTHNMVCEISQFGRPMDFGNLSAGQRARVNLALSFAFRDVLQSLHTPINVCMLDEVLDVGLDTIGVQAAARMLKRKARDESLSLYIISHRGNELDAAFDKIMTVQLSKGFSYIKEE